MPELLECRLDRIGSYYRWQALFRMPSGKIHCVSVAHDDAERAAQELGNLIDSVMTIFSHEYGRG